MESNRVSLFGAILKITKRLLPYAAVSLALLPVILYTWLAWRTRLIIDDYYLIRIGRELGAWDGMRFHLNTWSGGYTRYFYKSAIAPLDTWAPAVTLSLILLLGLIAAVWLVRGLLPWLGIKRPAWSLTLVVASSVITASIYGQYTWQSYFWHPAALCYSMPLMLLIFILALVVNSPLRGLFSPQILWRTVAGAVFCFFSAGIGEISAAVHATVLTLCLLITLVFTRGRVRRHVMVLFGAAWLATALSMLIQLNQPGVAIRMQAETEQFGPAIFDGWESAIGVLDYMIRKIGHPPAFAGFAFLFCIMLGATLFYLRPRPVDTSYTDSRLNRGLLLLGLLAQLLLLPLLWAHRSDDPQILGRFSPAYTVVVAVNAIFISFCALALWRRRQISAALTRNSRLAWHCLCAVIAATLMLFCFTWLRSIHWRASSYLYLSTLLLMALLTGQLSFWLRDGQLRKLFLLAVLSIVVVWLLFAAIVIAAFSSIGYVNERILSSVSSATVLAGSVWGMCLGSLIKQWAHERNANQRGVRRLGLCSALAAIVLGAGIVSSQVRLIPDFARYAREWDNRHQMILYQRDQGVRDVKVRPLSFDMYRFLGLTDDPAVRFRYALDYYGVDSITEEAA